MSLSASPEAPRESSNGAPADVRSLPQLDALRAETEMMLTRAPVPKEKEPNTSDMVTAVELFVNKKRIERNEKPVALDGRFLKPGDPDFDTVFKQIQGDNKFYGPNDPKGQKQLEKSDVAYVAYMWPRDDAKENPEPQMGAAFDRNGKLIGYTE